MTPAGVGFNKCDNYRDQLLVANASTIHDSKLNEDKAWKDIDRTNKKESRFIHCHKVCL